MNPRAKFRSTVLDKNYTSPPHFEAMGFWDETIERWHQEGLPTETNPWDYFGIDRFMDNAPEAIAYHTDRVTSAPYWPPFERKVLEQKDDTLIVQQDDGIITKQLTHGTSIPQFIRFPVQSEKDWQIVKLRLDADTPERYTDLGNVAQKLKGRSYILRFGLCGAYGHLRNLCGMENLSYFFYDCPEMIHRILKHWVAFNTALADHICPLIDFDYVFIWEDMAYKNGPLVSPNHFREFILPCYKELIGYLRQTYKFDIFMVDSDGNNWDLFPLFIEGGINVFTPLEIAAGMEPLSIREKYPQLALLGGIDKRALLQGKTEKIKGEVIGKVSKLLEKGGYFPCLDHHVPSDISFESFCRYLEILRKLVGPETLVNRSQSDER
jgi:uroporphyrinogen decarboxylase